MTARRARATAALARVAVAATLARVAVAAALLALAANAGAAGLSRPNVLGPRAIGLGGAFTGVADDPTAVWHNPAGTAFSSETSIYLGAELVFLQRGYIPSADSPLGKAYATAGQPTHNIIENTAPQIIPIIGGSTRFAFGKLKPSRFALSLLAYDVYGGAISFNPGELQNQGLLSTQIIDFEIAPALAYQVNDVVAIGAAVRIGVNVFDVNDNEPAFTAKLSALGVGAGGSFGVMLRPHRMIQIGATYRTPLSATMNGSGPITLVGGMPMSHNMNISITWPQSAALAVTIKPHPRFLATLQGDWMGWSSVEGLTINIDGLKPITRQMRYADAYAAHLGFQGIVTRWLALRAGVAYDGNSIPSPTMRRENQDAQKVTLAAGFGLHFWKIFIDGAFEAFVPTGARVVHNQQPAPTATDPPPNEAGTYEAHVYTAEIAAQIRF
jgi:long-chain fatty acid transport protein